MIEKMKTLITKDMYWMGDNIMKKISQSLIDSLILMMPSLLQSLKSRNNSNEKAANSLFSIWDNEKNRIRGNVYKRPVTISHEDVQDMQKAGFIRQIGNDIEITSKGESVIKTMILGDNSSSFEDKTVTYSESLANMDPSIKRTAKNTKVAYWWNRYED